MIKIGSASSSDTSEISLPAGPPSGGIRRGESGAGTPDPNVAAAASIQAGYQLRRLENTIPLTDNPANDPSLTRVGTLNVGDRYASHALNSRETVRAAAVGVAPTDRLALSVPGLPSTSATPPPSRPPVSPLPSADFHSTSSGHLSFSLFVLSPDEEEEELRRRAVMSDGGFMPSGHASGVAHPASGGSANPSTQRYVFEVRDVHSMGGTPSMLSIRDASGAAVGRYELPPGNSRLTVDLPPGQYTVEAQSGSRSVGGGGDQLDNFRVEVYSAGPTPSGGEGSGGAAD